MVMLQSTARKQKGFTLVELSIVLVIIGLIVSGVLVGQDLIQAARIRAQIRQIQELDTTINAFRAKYNGLPGDLASADSFGLVATAPTVGTPGDGIIDGVVTTATNEAAVVFEELSKARLVADTLKASETPATKLDRGRMAAFASGGINYWMFGAAASAPPPPILTTNTTVAAGAGFSGFELWSIDTRMDDGLPQTGLMRAAQDAIAFSGVALTLTTGSNPGYVMGDPGACVATADNETYVINVSTATAAGNTKNCAFITRING